MRRAQVTNARQLSPAQETPPPVNLLTTAWRPQPAAVVLARPIAAANTVMIDQAQGGAQQVTVLEDYAGSSVNWRAHGNRPSNTREMSDPRIEPWNDLEPVDWNDYVLTVAEQDAIGQASLSQNNVLVPAQFTPPQAATL